MIWKTLLLFYISNPDYQDNYFSNQRKAVLFAPVSGGRTGGGSEPKIVSPFVMRVESGVTHRFYFTALFETRRVFVGLSFFGSRRRCESAWYIIRNSAWRWNPHASRMNMT
jgi:hypothetical protein